MEQRQAQQALTLELVMKELHSLAAYRSNKRIEDDRIGNHIIPSPRVATYRTCRETHLADPSLTSGMYWIDPDGQGVGDDPIYVFCNMTTGLYMDYKPIVCIFLFI